MLFALRIVYLIGLERYRNRHPIPNTLSRNETNTQNQRLRLRRSVTYGQHISKQIMVYKRVAVTVISCKIQSKDLFSLNKSIQNVKIF